MAETVCMFLIVIRQRHWISNYSRLTSDGCEFPHRSLVANPYDCNPRMQEPVSTPPSPEIPQRVSKMSSRASRPGVSKKASKKSQKTRKGVKNMCKIKSSVFEKTF